jgi:hypothetical protein
VVDGSFDFRLWISMFTDNAITTIFLSNTYGFLDKGNDVCPARTETGEVRQVGAMDTFHSGSAHNRAIRSPTSRVEQGCQDITKAHPWQAERGGLLLDCQVPNYLWSEYDRHQLSQISSPIFLLHRLRSGLIACLFTRSWQSAPP